MWRVEPDSDFLLQTQTKLDPPLKYSFFHFFPFVYFCLASFFSSLKVPNSPSFHSSFPFIWLSKKSVSLIYELINIRLSWVRGGLLQPCETQMASQVFTREKHLSSNNDTFILKNISFTAAFQFSLQQYQCRQSLRENFAMCASNDK